MKYWFVDFGALSAFIYCEFMSSAAGFGAIIIGAGLLLVLRVIQIYRDIRK
jgi:hypothetical protein